MTEEQSGSNLGQMKIDFYFTKNDENQEEKQKRIKRRVEAEVVKKKTKQKSDEDDSQEQQQPPQINPKDYNKITKYCPTKIEQRQDQNNEDVQNLKLMLLQKDMDAKQLESRLADLEGRQAKDMEKQVYIKKKLAEQLAEALKSNEEYRREKMREYLERERYRLGESIQKRDNVRFVDEWIDGHELKSLKDQLKTMIADREKLEKEKKEMKSKFQLTSKRSDKQARLDINSDENLDIQQRKQRYTFQLSILEKEEKDLKNQIQQLEDQKQVYLQKLRKFNDEIQCRYSKTWPLIANRYQTLALLGKGGFSEVYKAFDLEESKFCGLKIHYLMPGWPEHVKNNYTKHAYRESITQQKLKHHNIVALYDIQNCDDDSFWYTFHNIYFFLKLKSTVLEYCDGGDLSSHLKKYKCLSEKEAKLIIRQVLAALHYMNQNQQKVIHYDLKPQNILFHKGEVKITDFGLCKIQEADTTRMELTSQGLGTYWYLPPECFSESGNVSINSKVDVWSVGVILYEMVFGKRPFGDGMSQEKIATVLHYINKKKEKIILRSTVLQFPTQKTSVSQECRDFISKCLTYNMEARWSVSEAYLSPYINKK